MLNSLSISAKRSLAQLRQLYFRMREEVFGKSAVSYNTAGLETMLKREFTETMCMDDVTYPRYEYRMVGRYGPSK